MDIEKQDVLLGLEQEWTCIQYECPYLTNSVFLKNVIKVILRNKKATSTM